MINSTIPILMEVDTVVSHLTLHCKSCSLAGSLPSLDFSYPVQHILSYCWNLDHGKVRVLIITVFLYGGYSGYSIH